VNEILKRIKERCDALGIKPAARVMTVSIARQLLGFYRDDCLVRSYVVSTSLRPPANVKDSLGTPRGLLAKIVTGDGTVMLDDGDTRANRGGQ